MEHVEGAQGFQASGEAYDAFMGRYSRLLAEPFADAVGVVAGQTVLDVGCGPGALTGVLVDRVGADSVSACDPSVPFVAACAARHPGVDVRLAPAEAIPFDDHSFDIVLSQLVLHFVSDPSQAAGELRRVLRPGGVAGACVWEFGKGMVMLRKFWDAALAVDPGAPDEQGLAFGGPGEIADLLETAGFVGIVESTLTVSTTYTGFEELWAGLLLGIGPAGSYLVSLPEGQRDRVRDRMFAGVGSPPGAFSLDASARYAHGSTPRG